MQIVDQPLETKALQMFFATSESDVNAMFGAPDHALHLHHVLCNAGG